ncbi:MAG: immunoglobulin domain-containing protein [Flavobacterium sp.]
MQKNLTLKFLMLFALIFSATAFGQTLTSFSPTVVTYRTKITIAGTGLTGYTTVKIGSVTATNVVATATQVTATVPDLNVSGGTDTNVTISVGNGTTTKTINGLTYIRPSSTVASTAKVTRVITDYNGYWSSAAASTSAASQPDTQHSVLAMQFGGVTFSTGVNDAVLTSKGVSFTAGDFKSLPINAITGTSGGGSNYIALATKMDGLASGLVPSAPGVAGLITRDILIDGKKGLGLGSGMTNITNTAVMLFNVNNIVTSRINDAEPDIIVSQTADPSTGSDNSVYDVYAFVDANGNVVGNPVYIVLNSIPAIGTYKLDLFSITANAPYETATINSTQSGSPETRDIRLVGYKLSDFGITDANKNQVTGFKIMPSGVSDPAFIAYNGNSLLIPAPQITVHPSSVVACTGAGSSATFSITATGNNLSYQWKKNGINISGATASSYTINNVSAADVAAYTVAVSNAAGAVISNAAYLNTIIAVQPVDVSACLNAPGPTVDVTAYGLNLSYQWYINTTASTTGATAVNGATSSSYMPPATATRYYYCVITNNGQGCTVQNTNIVKFSVGSAAVAGTATINGALGIPVSTYGICSGASGVVMKSTGATTTGASYQWEKSTDGTTGWVNVSGGSGATTTTYTTPAATENTYYRLRVTTGSCVVYTNNVTVTIDNYPGVVSPSVNICPGSTATLSTTGATGNLIWLKSTDGVNWTELLLTFMPTYTTEALTATTYYRVRSNIVLGCGYAYSDIITVTVNPGPTAGAISGTQTVCQNTTANLSVTGATGTIQWEQSANGIDGWAAVTTGTGATTASFTTAAMQATTYYRAAVTSNYCTTYTGTAKVTVNAIVAGAISANVTICAGSVAVLVVTGNVGNNIQWQESVNGTDGWANVTGGSGANTATYTTVSLFSTKYYRAIVTNGSCQAITAVVAVNVNLTNLGTLSANQTVCYGQSAILNTVGATGLLQWQESANGIDGWVNVTAGTGATTDTYVTTAVTVKRYFRLSVTAGLCNIVSSAITVDVSPLPNAGTVSSNKVICSGATTALSVTGTTGTLQWQQSANGIDWVAATGMGATTANFTTSALSTTTYYRVLATSGSCAAATSSTVTVTVNTAIAGTVSANQQICGGNTATVSVTGSAGSLQWQRSADGTTGWANITGATAASYTPVLLATTYYRVIATSGTCIATSDVVTISVSNPPTLGTASGTATICPGENATVSISGNSGSIQWQKSANGTNGWMDIDGATSSSYTAENVTATTYFRVILANGACQSASGTVTVTVNDTFIWNGTVSSDWHTAANWSCNAIPTLEDKCIIPQRPNQPVVSQNIMAYGKMLDIQAGAILTINTARNITVKNNIVVAATGNMIVNNTANLIQINDVANTGNIVVKRNSSKLYRQDYTLWSTPVEGQKIFQFSPQTLADRFYTYRDSARLYVKVPNLSAASTTTFTKGVAYLIRMPNSWPTVSGYNAGTTSITLNQQFTGVPNNGTIQVPVRHEWTPTAPGTLSEYGWNGVGNPYPSTINIHNFIDANSDNLETGILYFWRKKNNNNNTSYTAINKTGYAENRAEGGDVGTGFTEGDETNWVINPGQGFVVQVKQGTTHVTFNNNMRRASNNTQFFRSAQAAGQMSRMWINMESAEGAFSQTLLGYSSFTTDGLDYGYDGFLNNDGTLALYTKAANRNLVIQAKGEFNVADVVPLHYRANVAGQYTLKLHKKDGVFANGQSIYLHDNVTGTVHDFATGVYTFTAVQGTTEGRFDIIYMPSAQTPALGVEKPQLDEKSIIAYKRDNTLMVETPGTQISELRVYDIHGRLLFEEKNVDAESKAINLAAQEQMLVVQIITANGAKASKKLIY